jgi:hypothetical protein
LWTGANAATAMYAATNLNDLWLAVVSSVYVLCCMIVIALTAFKRLGSSTDEGRAHRPSIPKRRKQPRVGRTPEGCLT